MLITSKTLLAIAPGANEKVVDDLVKFLPAALDKYEINTNLRVAHFLAQACHESDHFRILQEYASGKAYEGRKDLGNTVPGYGVKFKGRGIFQLTGYSNYLAMSKKLGVDLVAHPELAATGEISVQTACIYWQTRGLNKFADADDIKTITKKINGGFNGLADRIACYNKVKAELKG